MDVAEVETTFDVLTGYGRLMGKNTYGIYKVLNGSVDIPAYAYMHAQRKISAICFIWCLTKYYVVFFKEVALSSCLKDI